MKIWILAFSNAKAILEARVDFIELLNDWHDNVYSTEKLENANKYLEEHNLLWSESINLFMAKLLGYRGDVKELFFKTVNYDHPELQPQSER